MVLIASQQKHYTPGSITSAPKTKSTNLSRKVILDLIAFSDILLVIGTAYLAKILYLDWVIDIDVSFRIYVYPSTLAAILFYMVLKNRGFYEPKDILKITIRHWKLFSSLALSFLISMSILYFVKVVEIYSRGWVVTWFALAFCSLLLSRYIYSALISYFAAHGRFRRRVAVIGDGQWALEVMTHLNTKIHEIDCVGHFPMQQDAPKTTVRQLADLAHHGGLDQIIIAMPLKQFEEHKKMLEELKFLSIDIELAPEHLSLDMPIRSVSRLDNFNMFSVQKKPITGWGLFLKSVEDSVLGLLFFMLSLPLMLLIAVLIKIDSKGPVFFIQRRHGLNGQIIRVVKFRTMTVLEDGAEVKQAGKNDLRITKVGALLRRSSLDELPQLWNVLRGEMSLVGPRPHAMTHDHYYGEMFEIYANRQRVKPGLTGWAQVNGLRGETSDPELMRQRIHFDIFYIENWSLWLDCKIIIATFFVGFFNKKAY